MGNRTGRFGPFLSPFLYSPEVTVRVGDLLITPALWVGWAPLAFRATPQLAQRRAFRAAIERFVADLRGGRFRRGLRVKSVQGATGIFEMTWPDDGPGDLRVW
ncbi:MAG: hypothetical protein ACRENM_08355 [Candidatus Dormibacteraceae bacterium]